MRGRMQFCDTADYKSALPADELPQRDYTLAAIATRFEPAEMPSGRCTFQRRSLWSTCRTRLALPGGWSPADSMKRKSGPMCVTLMDAPLTISRISTLAECAP